MLSVSESFIREWRLYIEDMISFAERVIAYSAGLDQPAFEASGINYDATLRNIELSGEAATRIPADIRVKFPEIPWRMIIAVRNRLIHGYLGLDNDTLWSIVQTDVPLLLFHLQEIRRN